MGQISQASFWNYFPASSDSAQSIGCTSGSAGGLQGGPENTLLQKSLVLGTFSSYPVDFLA